MHFYFICLSFVYTTIFFFFFFNDPATTEIYTLPLHDALPIWARDTAIMVTSRWFRCTIPPLKLSAQCEQCGHPASQSGDRKSTRLNSSHSQISYAVFCLKKKKDSTSIAVQYISSPLSSSSTID